MRCFAVETRPANETRDSSPAAVVSFTIGSGADARHDVQRVLSIVFMRTRTTATTHKQYDPQADFIRPRHLPQATGLSETTIWRERRAGRFPEPIQLSPGAKGWTRPMIARWREERARRRARTRQRQRKAGTAARAGLRGRRLPIRWNRHQ